MDRNKVVRARFASVVPIPPGLVAFWRGETDASDLTGRHNGAFFSGPSASAPSVTPAGKVGGAFNFSGTVHIRVPAPGPGSSLKPPQITVELWVYPNVQSTTDQAIIACGFST